MDLVWYRPREGWLVTWTFQGNQRGEDVWSQLPPIPEPFGAGRPALRADIDGDGDRDVVWLAGHWGARALTLEHGAVVDNQPVTNLALSLGATWNGFGDMDGDGRADFVSNNLWDPAAIRNPRSWTLHRFDGPAIVSRDQVMQSTAWQIAGIGDMDGDGRADILWDNVATGQLWAQLMDRTTIIASGPYATPGRAWSVVAMPDLNGDRRADTVLRTAEGHYWGIVTGSDGISATAQGWLGTAGAGWRYLTAIDATGDGKDDLLFRSDEGGHLWLWAMDGARIEAELPMGTVGGGWQFFA